MAAKTAKPVQSELLNETQAAAFLNVDAAQLARWRLARRGPCYVDMGSDIVRYSKRALRNWISHCTVRPW